MLLKLKLMVRSITLKPIGFQIFRILIISWSIFLTVQFTWLIIMLLKPLIHAFNAALCSNADITDPIIQVILRSRLTILFIRSFQSIRSAIRVFNLQFCLFSFLYWGLGLYGSDSSCFNTWIK